MSLINKWQQEGVVTPEQAAYMQAELEHTTSERSGKLFISAIGLIGALTLSSGVLLMIASNWSALGKPIQLFLSLLMPVVPISFAYYRLVVQGHTGISGRAANVLGVALIGGSIAMIAQIYHLEANYTSFLWTWTALAAPFIIVFRREENVAFVAITLAISLFLSLIDMLEIFDDEQAFSITVSLGALLYAAVLYGLGSLLRQSMVWKASARVLRLMSAPLATATLFIMTFEFYARAILDLNYRDPSIAWVPVSVILNLVFIGFAVFVLIRALRYQEERLAFNAVRVLGLYLVVKYFTLFSTMLETGLLMTLGGLIFISGAWYLERNKQRLLSLLRSKAHVAPTAPSQFAPNSVNNYE